MVRGGNWRERHGGYGLSEEDTAGLQYGGRATMHPGAWQPLRARARGLPQQGRPKRISLYLTGAFLKIQAKVMDAVCLGQGRTSALQT
ncbi:hypothetical protein NDU88_005437 [Pleurodeles waltl]|uniref:Uncharacterized protein n=1 Tax=Pleurodeles waltl TaxID=8319 RepID=A0AAV7TUT7_PLEWA|nr:hypothetical protein NDU88_005437 [Pleurodeles waltl]